MGCSKFQLHHLLFLITYIIFVDFNLLVSSSKVNSSEIEDEKYLQKYGNMNESSNNSVPLISQKAIKDFQKYSGLHETGRSKREMAIPNVCKDASIDAATTTEDGKTYLFKDDYYYELTGVWETRIADDHPRKINEDWGGLPGKLDAALTMSNGTTFFFKGNKYWSFRNKKMDFGYPKAMLDGFDGIPSDIDAAFFWGGNRKAYFFKGSQHWQYIDPNQPIVSVSYPVSISTWRGLPNDIDAALQFTNKITYFFKEQSYYKFDDVLFSVANADESGPYPRPTARWWFGCPEVTTSIEQLTTASFSEVDMHPTEDDDFTMSSAISSGANLLFTLLMLAVLL